jgi:hypothetical protein
MKNQNTYSLLVASQEKGRSIFEGSVFALVVLCTAISGWEFASNSVSLPRMPANNGAAAVEVAQTPAPAPVIASRS